MSVGSEDGSSDSQNMQVLRQKWHDLIEKASKECGAQNTASHRPTGHSGTHEPVEFCSQKSQQQHQYEPFHTASALDNVNNFQSY